MNKCSVSIQVSCLMKPGSVLLLVARSDNLLQQLKEELPEKPQLVVHCIAVDLSTTEGVNETLKVARQKAVNDIDHVLVFNNGGESFQTSVTKQPRVILYLVELLPPTLPSSLSLFLKALWVTFLSLYPTLTLMR